APGSYPLTLEDASGAVLAQTDIAIEPGTFTTRTLRVDPAFVNPPRSALPRIAKESALLQEVFAHMSDTAWAPPVTRPVPHKANSRFGQRSVFNGEPRGSHGGTDFLSPAGTPIRAPMAGRVVVARNLYFAGGSVIIDHGNGMFSQLAHMSKIVAVEGHDVAAGDIIGLVGATGRVTGAHLHWALRIGGARVDPLSLAEQIAGSR
ncbi:MAG: M23 family metallopeptidase, partial [Acidobacteria bacterium]|nr:M23 family metallopeptidase [Acidobacteriota bacterium]